MRRKKAAAWTAGVAAVCLMLGTACTQYEDVLPKEYGDWEGNYIYRGNVRSKTTGEQDEYLIEEAVLDGTEYRIAECTDWEYVGEDVYLCLIMEEKIEEANSSPDGKDEADSAEKNAQETSRKASDGSENGESDADGGGESASSDKREKKTTTCLMYYGLKSKERKTIFTETDGYDVDAVYKILDARIILQNTAGGLYTVNYAGNIVEENSNYYKNYTFLREEKTNEYGNTYFLREFMIKAEANEYFYRTWEGEWTFFERKEEAFSHMRFEFVSFGESAGFLTEEKQQDGGGSLRYYDLDSGKVSLLYRFVQGREGYVFDDFLFVYDTKTISYEKILIYHPYTFETEKAIFTEEVGVNCVLYQIDAEVPSALTIEKIYSFQDGKKYEFYQRAGNKVGVAATEYRSASGCRGEGGPITKYYTLDVSKKKLKKGKLKTSEISEKEKKRRLAMQGEVCGKYRYYIDRERYGGWINYEAYFFCRYDTERNESEVMQFWTERMVQNGERLSEKMWKSGNNHGRGYVPDDFRVRKD